LLVWYNATNTDTVKNINAEFASDVKISRSDFRAKVLSMERDNIPAMLFNRKNK
jgi:hypothetical protein